MQQPATTTVISSPMINDLNEKTAIQPNSTHDDANPLNNKLVTFVHGMRKTTNIATELLVHMAFKKLLTIHDKQKRFMADCAWPGVWANVGKIHQHQLDPTRATNHVLAGYYPRDVIKWIHA